MTAYSLLRRIFQVEVDKSSLLAAADEARQKCRVHSDDLKKKKKTRETDIGLKCKSVHEDIYARSKQYYSSS